MIGTRRNEQRQKRQLRVRKRVRGTPVRPRLCVFRSARHIYAQVISDEDGRTLVAASTLELEGDAKTGNATAAKEIGNRIAKKCLDQSISEVVFDRNGFLYHGRVKALAEGAREGGLKF